MRIPPLPIALFLIALSPALGAQNRQIELEWLRHGGATLTGVAAADEAGSAVAGAGDVNGDGVDDLLLGAWKVDGAISDVGAAYLVFGGPALRDGSFGLSAADVVLHGDPAQNAGLGGPRSAFAVAGAGDVNGDGFDDILLGAPQADTTGTDSGAAYLVFGGPALPTSLDLGSLGSAGVTFAGLSAGSNTGSSVALGDVNGDGFDDVILGAPGASPGASLAGTTCVVFGAPVLAPAFALADLQTLPGLGMLVNGIAQSDRSGDVVAHVGDVNGDGFGDLAIGARRADPGGQVNAGQSYVLYGAVILPQILELSGLGSAGMVIDGDTSGDQVPVSCSGGGDVNGDGFDDLLLGSNLVDPPAGTNAGRAYLVYGDASWPTTLDLGALGSGGVTFSGIAALDGAGISVALGGDANRDGLADLLIGAQEADPNGNVSAGETYLVFGSASLPASLDLGALDADGVVLAGADPNDTSGFAVAFAGDVDADGFCDLLVGARQADPGGANNAGEATLVYGNCHCLQAAGPVAEGGTFDFRAHGTPGVPYATFVALATHAGPLQTNFGPWWLQGQINLFGGVFGSNGASELLLFVPVSTPSLAGLEVHMQVLGQPQGQHCDLTGLLSFTIE